MIADILNHALIVMADGIPAAPHHRRPLARAEAAVHGADVRGHHQRPVRVAVRQARYRRVLVLFQRIFQFEARRVLCLQR